MDSSSPSFCATGASGSASWFASGIDDANSSPFSSATSCMSRATSSGGVVAAVVLPMACSTNSVWTSRFSNCRSNVSMFSLTFSRLLSFSDASRDLTMVLMFLLTMFILCWVSSLDTTPSRREASRSMLRFSFFLRMESVAWIFAPSMLPFWIAVFTCADGVSGGVSVLFTLRREGTRLFFAPGWN